MLLVNANDTLLLFSLSVSCRFACCQLKFNSAKFVTKRLFQRTTEVVKIELLRVLLS